MKTNQIINKKNLSASVSKFDIYAPAIASKAKAGQFVILRFGEDGERVPVTLVDWDDFEGLITLIIQTAGKSTATFNAMNEGDGFDNIAGPLGMPVEIKNYGTAAVVGGGVGVAEVYPIAKALKAAGNKVISVLGARNKDSLILEKEMSRVCDATACATDDGSRGIKGFAADALKELHNNGTEINVGFVIGPTPMMKFTCKLMKELGIKPYASLNPIMLDGTGMCGCCRVIVGGEIKFACVDGPMFPADDIDFDNLILRTSEYKDVEAQTFKKYQEQSGHKCKIGLR